MASFSTCSAFQGVHALMLSLSALGDGNPACSASVIQGRPAHSSVWGLPQYPGNRH